MSNLDLTFYCDDLDGEVSIRLYLAELLRAIWNEGEGFSGKRPFGNSGWQIDLFLPLVAAGVIKGEIDDDEGDLLDYDLEAGNAEINRLIDEMCGTESGA